MKTQERCRVEEEIVPFLLDLLMCNVGDTQKKCPGSYKALTAGSAPGEKKGKSMRM